MRQSQPGKGNSLHDLIMEMKSRGKYYLGAQVALCLRHTRTLNNQPRNDSNLCLRDSATFAASKAGRDLTKEFREERSEEGWLQWLERFSPPIWLNSPLPVRVDWQSGIVKRAKYEEYACLEDVEPCLYNRDTTGKFVRQHRPLTNSYVACDASEDIANAEATLQAASITERKAIIDARLGQGAYRTSLLKLWGLCAVTGCKNELLLQASHIKPWRSSDNRERIDKYNGFLLTPTLDKLFDKGLISFANSGNIMLSPKLKSTDASILGVSADMKLCYVYDENKLYLADHRKLHGFE